MLYSKQIKQPLAFYYGLTSTSSVTRGFHSPIWTNILGRTTSCQAESAVRAASVATTTRATLQSMVHSQTRSLTLGHSALHHSRGTRGLDAETTELCGLMRRRRHSPLSTPPPHPVTHHHPLVSRLSMFTYRYCQRITSYFTSTSRLN